MRETLRREYHGASKSDWADPYDEGYTNYGKRPVRRSVRRRGRQEVNGEVESAAQSIARDEKLVAPEGAGEQGDE
jgi:hypothetical protein